MKNKIYAFLSEIAFTSRLMLLLLLLFLPSLVNAQTVQFTADSIPEVNGEVVFNVDFKYDLKKSEFYDRAYYYLNRTMDPYSGKFLVNNDDFTVCEVTDYLNISSSAFQVFAMYMTYSLQLTYMDGICNLVIKDIRYMEKGYFETQEESTRELNMPEHSGKDIMIDKNYSRLLSGNPSDKITALTLDRINEIIQNLDISFAK